MSNAVTLVLTLHVFHDGNQKRVEIWEGPKIKGDPNPVLLRAEDAWGNTTHHLFSLDKVRDGKAFYHPVATYASLPLLEDLPKWGFRLVSAKEESNV